MQSKCKLLHPDKVIKKVGAICMYVYRTKPQHRDGEEIVINR